MPIKLSSQPKKPTNSPQPPCLYMSINSVDSWSVCALPDVASNLNRLQISLPFPICYAIWIFRILNPRTWSYWSIKLEILHSFIKHPFNFLTHFLQLRMSTLICSSPILAVAIQVFFPVFSVISCTSLHIRHSRPFLNLNANLTS